MNVVLISPHFPPQFFLFAVALKERGVNVLGLADAPHHELRPELRDALAEYYATNVEDLDQARRAMGWFIWKRGRIDRIDSHNEHWLGLEAQLREDFNVEGPRPAEMHRRRTKSGMAGLFRKADVPCPPGELVQSDDQVRAFARAHGYPLVFKPDLGVGAARTFKVTSAAELDAVLAQPLSGYIVQPFIEGTIVSYDGLVTRDGRIVFETSHVYSGGIMEVVTGKLDVYYWNRREIPRALRTLGQRVVDGFGIRERFFHVEFFERPDGSYCALEVNIRPPGGFTTDMMNYSADIDVYRLWARMLTGDPLTDFTYERKYHVAHVARRRGRSYRLSHEELVQRLGDRLLVFRDVPEVLAGAMGDQMYLIRDPDLGRLTEAIADIQAS
ncbi:MAG: ATP-grasp domain-containing protein [Myxococcaceae bacterium]|nr:ATP-grasp domain-containing protein [Myxococcaceae bacterium]